MSPRFCYTWLTFRGGCTNVKIRGLNQTLWRSICRTSSLPHRRDPDRVIAGAIKSLQHYRSDAQIVSSAAHQLPMQLLLGGYIGAAPGWNPGEIDQLIRRSRTSYTAWASSSSGKLAIKRTLARWNTLQAAAHFLQQLTTEVTKATTPVPATPAITSDPATRPWRLPFRNANHGLLMDTLST